MVPNTRGEILAEHVVRGVSSVLWRGGDTLSATASRLDAADRRLRDAGYWLCDRYCTIVERRVERRIADWTAVDDGLRYFSEGA